jgi:hypothetical protein
MVHVLGKQIFSSLGFRVYLAIEADLTDNFTVLA